METLKEIKDGDVPILKNRKAARAVIFDNNGLTPVLFVSKYNYHKIPGGGIKKGENIKIALEREVLEETGSKIVIIGEVGKIIEYRSKWNLKQVSYCYLGNIVSKGDPSFTGKEKEKGFKLKWLSIKEAILKFENDKPIDYEGSFIQKRDIAFLKKTLEIKKR